MVRWPDQVPSKVILTKEKYTVYIEIHNSEKNLIFDNTIVNTRTCDNESNDYLDLSI